MDTSQISKKEQDLNFKILSEIKSDRTYTYNSVRFIVAAEKWIFHRRIEEDKLK